MLAVPPLCSQAGLVAGGTQPTLSSVRCTSSVCSHSSNDLQRAVPPVPK